MEETPLLAPFLLDAACPSTVNSKKGQAIPVSPTHIVSWPCEAGPSRLALAGRDKTIWVISDTSSSSSSSRPAHPRKSRSTENASKTPTIPLIRSPASPSGHFRPLRPPAPRTNSYSGRPRAGSSTSSIYSTSSMRRVSAFSPPPSARQLPVTTLSSATALAAPPDAHTHHTSLSDRAELREQLREQSERPREENVGVGLGIAGIGRKGLTGVHGKEDLEHGGTAAGSGSGAITPVSSASAADKDKDKDKDGSASTGGMFGFWRNSGSSEADREQELKEQMEEVEVERAMEKERKDGQREKEDMKMVEQMSAVRSPALSARNVEVNDGDDDDALLEEAEGRPGPVRLILPQPGRGRVVAFKAFVELDIFCVLRDEGILDIVSLGTLHRIASIDLEAPEKDNDASKNGKDKLRLTPFWSWKGVHLAQKEDAHVLVVHGLPWPCALPSPNGEVTRVIMLNVDVRGEVSIAARLELPGEGDVGISKGSDESYLLHATHTSLTSYPIIFPSPPPQYLSDIPQSRASPQMRAVSSVFPSPILRPSTPYPPASPNDTDRVGLRKSASHSHLRDAANQSQVTQHLLGHGHAPPSDKSEKGFAKFLAARRADWTRKTDKDDKADQAIEAGIGEGQEVERDGYGQWHSFILRDSGEGAGMGEDAVDVFFCDGRKLEVRGRIVLPDHISPTKVIFTPGWEQVIIGTTDDQAIVYRSHRNDVGGKNLTFESSNSFDTTRAIHLSGLNHLLVAQETGLYQHTLGSGNKSSQLIPLRSDESEGRWTHVVPADVETLFAADHQGNVRCHTLAAFIESHPAQDENETSADRLDSAVTCLKVITTTTNRYIVAGDEDGAIRIWTAGPFKLCGSWTMLADPVHSISLLDMPQAGVLRGSLLCTSREGTAGIISLTEMDDLFLIPASRAPLRRIFVGGPDILLVYANGKSRMWNVETGEFRRSTGLDAADDMLQSGEWAEVQLENPTQSSPLTALPSVPQKSQLGQLLLLDLRELGKWLHSAKNNPHHSPLPVLRALLSLFLTFGVDESVDDTCLSKLGIRKPSTPIIAGLAGDSSSCDLIYATRPKAWQVSPSMTGLRQLVIVALLRPFLDSPDHERWAAEAIAFYTTSLPAQTVEADLEFFAGHYMDSYSDVHQAARMLFAARVARMTETEIESTVETHQDELPTSLPVSERFLDGAARALTLLGGIAVQKYQSLPPGALRAIAESVQLYLNANKNGRHMALAIELCSRGFTIWQLHVDPMDLLRRLFHLATNKETPSSTSARPTSSTSTSIAAQARLAALSIATSNAPLFMSTLSMDIRDAKTVEGRTSIMKLCVFMARKKPALLENGLPRIAEAVVKSLDPNVGKMREDVWGAATVILNELVLAFSTIDFHSGTQRLAVGTHEGAVIMYDLKTASRLYVLEPHKCPVSAVTFSPDGRRLITVSLEEGSVTIWKVGSSLSGFFNVVAGGPPRQGAEKGEPFKRIEFMRVDNDPLDSTAALSDIQITWPGTRQARVTIKETALTFET